MRGFVDPSSARPLRPRSLSIVAPLVASLSLLLCPEAAHAVEVPGQIVLQSGDTPTAGPAVVDMGPPFVNAAGEVGFVGTFDDGDHYVFIGNQVVWSGTDDAMMTPLDQIELTMDSDGAGAFVYAVDINGADGLYTDAGVFAAAGDPAPMMAAGTVYTFLSAPSMTSDGSIYWVAGFDADLDGFTDGRALYRTPDGTHASAEVVVAAGDMFGAFTVDDNTQGIDFSYAISEDGLHSILLLNMEGATAADGHVVVDDQLIAREIDPTGQGDNWDNFGLVAINTAGNYLFSGDTDGPTATDQFLAYNGTIVVREGDLVDGVEILGGAQMRFLSLSDLEQATYAFGYPSPAGFRETVFFACNAADISNTSQTVFTTVDDSLDVDDDGVGDFDIIDVTISAPTDGKAFGEISSVFVEVALDDGMGVVTAAMVEFPVTCCGNGLVDPLEECDDSNAEETDDCLSTCLAASCGDGFLQDGVEECDDGNLEDGDDCPTNCLAATCGDGFVLDGVEECDDGNDDDTDDCTAECVAAACGDGLVQDGVEECDDGNTDSGDGCEADCTLPGGVDDTGTGDSGAGTGDSGAPTSDSGGASDSGGNATNPATITQGMPGDDSGTEGDSDSESSGGATPLDDGCACSADAPRRNGWAWGLALLGLWGVGRRRRR